MSDDEKQVPEASTEPDIAEEEEKPPQLPFAVDYDKRGVAKCKVCKVKFDKGEFRLAKYGFNPFSSAPMKIYHHIQCLFETFKKARATTKKIDDVEEDIEDWDKIEEDDKANVLDALKEYRKFCEAKGISSKTIPKKDVPNKVAKAQLTPVQKGKPDTEMPENSGKVAVKKEVSPADEKLTAKDNSFREFRRLCANIADESSYLAKTEEVKKFLTKGTGGDKFRGDTELWVRLLLPGVIKRVYNLQSKQLVKLFAQIFNCNHEEMISDLESGDVAETVCVFFERSTGVTPAKKSDVTLQQVDAWLSKLEGLTKEEEQAAHLASIARHCTSNDLKMFVRLVKADLRINAGAKHILDGVHPDAYAAFQTTRNIGAVLQQAASRGGAGNEGGTGMTRALSIRANVLTPVLPMLAAACKSVEQAFKKCPNGMYAEIKYDGERVQLHKMGSEFKYFSRSLKPVTDHKVSHFAEYIPSAFLHGNDLILDAEVLLVDTNTGDPLPFGTLGVHKKGEFKDAKVCLFVFDCIHYNGENLMKKPLQERRAILQRNMTEVEHRVQFSEMQHIRRQEELRTLIARVLSQGLEGLVLKDVNSIYEPGKRHWLKVKKDYLADGAMADSADLVVLGAWYGTGKKGGMMSVFLMGCYDPDTDKWCTVSKVHTGHDDATLEQLQTDLRMDKIGGDYDRVPAWLKCTRALTPDFVASDPKNSPVWEITGAEFTQNQGHTADGISIRFPRVTKMRDDKTWKEATNLPYLKELFKSSKGKDFSELLGVSPAANSLTVKKEQEEDASNRNSSDDKDHASNKDAAGPRSLDSDDGTGKKRQRRDADKDDKKKNCENGKDEQTKVKMEVDDDAQSKNSKKEEVKTEKKIKQDNKETEKRSKEDDNRASKKVKGKEEDTDKRSKDKSGDRSEGASRNSRRNRSPEKRDDKRSRDSSGGGEDDGRERRKRRKEEQHSSGKVAKHE